MLARRLHGWSDKMVGHVTSQLGLAREVLHQLEIMNNNRDLTLEENWLKNNLKKHALALASLKRTIARLRFQIGWLQDRDANTRLFHLHSWHHKQKNIITKIVTAGHTLTNHDDKANAMCHGLFVARDVVLAVRSDPGHQGHKVSCKSFLYINEKAKKGGHCLHPKKKHSLQFTAHVRIVSSVERSPFCCITK
jgi:hypothetical protein